MKKRKRISIQMFLLQIALIIWAVFQIFPIFWMYYSSFKPSNEILMHIWSFPKSFYLDNYIGIFDPSLNVGGISIAVLYKNSLIVTAGSLIILAIVPAIAAYTIAKMNFRGRNLVTIFMIAMFAIPAHTIVLPLFYFFSSIGLLNNYFGLIFPYVAINIPFSIILLQSYFREFPDELLEAARIDGCSELRLFFSVVYPISKGAVSTVLIVALINVWNEFLFAIVIMRSMLMKTLPPGLSVYQGQYISEWGYLFAAMSSATIPIIILYFIFQRNIIKGMTLGAIKG